MDMQIIYEIASQTRKELEVKYGNHLAGRCIEASETICHKLEQYGISCHIVEGWCLYDNFTGCTNYPYDAHTWLELDETGIYVDVTATQFIPFIEDEIPSIIIGKKPAYMLYNMPDEELLEEIGW